MNYKTFKYEGDMNVNLKFVPITVPKYTEI